ncbi:MMPL family transporter [Yinghuangia seranimata]|uniref:MMPL family transporter n=1 Tax=Yinghuangia seranimata TaxID=408067 RepID=UPI00248B2758|nr:MMPL family transporter [Yinghuangia seranimata]MDI2130931.1 MMPL family transporter [Yinghuangia seranimata]
MLEPLGRLAYRRRRWIVAAAVLFAALAGLFGSTVFDHLTGTGFTYAKSESSRAAEQRRAIGGSADADVVVVFHSDRWTVDEAPYEQAAQRLLAGLPADRVRAVTAYWTTHRQDLVNADRHTTFAAIQVAGDDEAARTDNYTKIHDRLASPDLQVTVGGPAALFDEVNTQSKEDLGKAEALALPVLFVLLILIFRNVRAAALPVVIGVLAIVGSLAVLRVMALLFDVSVFAVNIVTLLGLGLAIDYSLFVVSRFREEMAAGVDVPDALCKTMVTAGRTIAVSAVTVAVALSSLFVFPQTFLRSLGLGGIAAVLLAVLFSLTVMPALLAVLGPRAAAWKGRKPADPGRTGWWERIARAVMRRPVPVAFGVLVVLVLLGLPYLKVSYGWLDSRVLPTSAHSRQAQDVLDREFTRNATNPVQVAVTLPVAAESPEGRAALGDYVQRAEKVPGVVGAEVTGVKGNSAKVDVRFTGEPISGHGRDVVAGLRALPPPPGGTALVGGNTAVFADLLDMLGARLPYMLLVMVLATFVLLFFSFGSVVLPVNAILMNAVTLLAAFGVVVFLFQEGHLEGVLDFTPTGTIDVVQLILILAVAFALSMDYSVFLLSRVREQYDLTGDNREAVAVGVQRSGRIITTAALLLVVVIGAFATSQVLIVKIIGVGLATAIVIDATVIRVLLVPATMRLLGDANWWAPRFARPWYARWGVREGGDAGAPELPRQQGSFQESPP